MSNWWANKVGTAPRPTQPLPGPPTGGNPYPQAPFQPAPPPPQHPVETYEPPDQTDPHNHHRNIWRWQGNQRGGAGETKRTGNCPACGSARFFSRAGNTVTNTNTGLVAAPRAICEDCGYPLEQMGSGAGSGAKVVGRPRMARQDEAEAPTGSLGHLRRN